LLETLTGSTSVVAHDARLAVTFNPRTVAGYRLLGHEATARGGLSAESLAAEVRAQQTAVAVYEIWLKPDSRGAAVQDRTAEESHKEAGDDDLVAEAEATWTDPRDGRSQRIRQPISRLQFANSFEESPLSLQAATLAGETAEVLRNSYFTDSPSRNFDAVLEAARRVNPRLAAREEHQRFVRLIEELQRVSRQQGGK
jgi:Ca-activated chloride channel family protein